MKGNLIELATAFIMGTAFAAVVTATTNVIMSIILKVSGGKEPNFDAWQPGGLPIGAFITALISFLLMAAIVYFLIVAPYQKAKELWFPAEESDETPADVAVLEEIRDLLKAQRG
jgi:large conductance mechanosensitive channel